MSRDTGKIPSKRHVESFRLRERLEPIRRNSYWDVGCVTLCKRQGRSLKMPEKQKIIVTVSDGIVCEVYSTEKDTIVEVIDYDSEDCEYADEQVGKLVERMHKIY
jgi:hypothetical protein